MKLAPVPEMVRYLAIFHRAFRVIASYKADRNPGIAVLGGYLANALHNVPDEIWHYDTIERNKLSESRSVPTEYSSTQTLIWGSEAPEHIRVICEKILAKEGCAEELELLDDLSDIDVAPPHVLKLYLDLLYQNCLRMRGCPRGNRNVSFLPWRRHRRSSWRLLRLVWTREKHEQGLHNAYLAQTLLPLIPALVRWNTFDEEQFHQSIQANKRLIPEQFKDRWEDKFKPWSHQPVDSANDPGTSESR